jgi:hypothetical protein
MLFNDVMRPFPSGRFLLVFLLGQLASMNQNEKEVCREDVGGGGEQNVRPKRHY